MNRFVYFCVICVKIIRNWGVASPHQPAKYPQLPDLMIGQIETLIWRIELPWLTRVDHWSLGERPLPPPQVVGVWDPR